MGLLTPEGLYLSLQSNSEPYILFIGDSFNIDENQTILDLPWDCVFTTLSTDQFDLERALSKDDRKCIHITDANRLNSNALNRHNLKVVYTNAADVAEDSPKRRLAKLKQSAALIIQKIPMILENRGHLVIDSFSPSDVMTPELLADVINVMRQKSVVYFGASEFSETLTEALSEGQASVFENSIFSFLSPFLHKSEHDNDVEQERLVDGEAVQLYVNPSKLFTAKKKDLVDLSNFATLLSFNEIESEVVPKYLYESYFYTFLRDSAESPQWYGYRCGFNLVRNYEEDLYRRVRYRLENPRIDKAKITVLCGQTGSGKSVALGYLAYRIFCERSFPVIYINQLNVDFTKIIYKKRSSRDAEWTEDRNFGLLEECIRNLETAGAKSVLLIWDTSVFGHEFSRCINLFDRLNNLGLNFHLVCTTYGNPKMFNNEYQKDIQPIPTSIFLCSSDNPAMDEVGKFRQILKEKARLLPADIDRIIKTVSEENARDVTENSDSLLSILYYMYDQLRPHLAKGVKSEAVTTITETIIALNLQPSSDENASRKIISIALAPANYSIETVHESGIDKFLMITAICTKFNLGLPFDFGYRFFETQDSQRITQILSIPLLSMKGKGFDEQSCFIRSRLEAKLLLRALNANTPERQVDLICYLIEKIDHGYNREKSVLLVRDLLIRIGPNSVDKKVAENYRELYPRIINALRILRENGNTDSKLVLQEINYLRQYYMGLDKGDDTIGSHNKLVSHLAEAIDIGLAERDRMLRQDYCDISLLNKIIVEVCISSLEFIIKTNPSDLLNRFARLRKDLDDVLWRTPDDSYAYVIWLRVMIQECSYAKDTKQKDEIIASIFDLIDRVRQEHPRIAANDYFAPLASEFYRVHDFKIGDNYFNELIQRRSHVGIYLRVISRLKECGIYDVNFRLVQTLTDEQSASLDSIYTDLLDNVAYRSIIEFSWQCQYLRLQLYWLKCNGHPAYTDPVPSTSHMTEQEWNEFNTLCRRYKEEFIDCKQISTFNSISVLYLLALSYAQLKDYPESLRIIRRIKNETVDKIYEGRLKSRHLLCDSNGVPRTFFGRFISESPRNLKVKYVKIEQINEEDNDGHKGVYCHIGNLIKTTDLSVSYSDFQLGIGFMGFSVYRGWKDGRE